jgi:hypothetical protein
MVWMSRKLIDVLISLMEDIASKKWTQWADFHPHPSHKSNPAQPPWAG